MGRESRVGRERRVGREIQFEKFIKQVPSVLQVLSILSSQFSLLQTSNSFKIQGQPGNRSFVTW